ncbi:unnamed protein product [Onchocerca flexuosa]|uniref:Protein FAR1-RELATED SEQUENCE n=1 Tax=Onchocerca flexuosa TaxID=387005 RepID=A0A183HC82_9BILA|nr:unnamed protein product [Onchocerca flexuosa]
MEVKSQEMEEGRIDESNLLMEAESSTSAAELQTIKQVKKRRNRSGNALEATARNTLIKQFENGIQTSDSSNNTHKKCKAKSDKQEREKMSGKQNDEGVHNPVNAPSTAKRKRSESKLLNFNERYGYRTFSTFTPSEQEELQREASYIYDGAIFRSFDEFKIYFEAFKIVENHPYRVSSSELLRDDEGKVIERFKYKYVVFHCAHYGHPRKRGIF